jgi:Tfp pilus assembly protein PilE
MRVSRFTFITLIVSVLLLGIMNIFHNMSLKEALLRADRAERALVQCEERLLKHEGNRK